MASYPARNHTKRGYAIARQELPMCRNEQPLDECPCDACRRWVATWLRHHISYQDLTSGAQ